MVDSRGTSDTTVWKLAVSGSNNNKRRDERKVKTRGKTLVRLD